MRALVILLAVGITWTQVTPTDNKGCAGYSPTITDQPTRVEYQQPNHHSGGDIRDTDDSDSGGRGYGGHHLGDNRGHGQYGSVKDDRGWSGKNTDED